MAVSTKSKKSKVNKKAKAATGAGTKARAKTKSRRGKAAAKSHGSKRKLRNKPYRVGRAKTGLGLFATKPIKKGTFIIRYIGPVLPATIADEMDNKYLFELTKKLTVDGSPRRNIARYVNHSCRPNAEADVKKRKILITAIKNIQPGDEITYNYGRNYFNTFLKPIGCKCPHCMAKRKEERAHQRMLAKRRAQRHARAEAAR